MNEIWIYIHGTISSNREVSLYNKEGSLDIYRFRPEQTDTNILNYISKEYYKTSVFIQDESFISANCIKYIMRGTI